MKLIKRAGLYIVRQKQKSILLSLTLILIATLVLTGISIYGAVSSTFSDVHRNIAGTITLDRSPPELDHVALIEAQNDGRINDELVRQLNSGDFVTFDQLEAIMAIPGVDGYNITAEYSLMDVVSHNFNFTSSQISTLALSDRLIETYTAGFQSATNTEHMLGFLNGNITLVDGRHLTNEDFRKVLISDELAEYNNLQVGDTLKISGKPLLTSGEFPSSTLEFEIVGIFSGVRSLEEGETVERDLFDSLALYADTLIIDMATLMEEFERTNFFGTDMDNSLPGPLSIFIEDPNEIENIYYQISNLPEIYGKSFSLTMGTEGFEDIIDSLGALQMLVLTLIVIIALVSVAILGILLTIWMRGRVKEIGIYLANGIKKGEILTQFIIEAFVIAVVAFAISMPISGLVAEGAGDFILTQFASAEALRNEQLEGSEFQDMSGMGVVSFRTDTGFMDEADLANTLEWVNVSITGNNLILVYAVGLPVVFCSVLIASSSIFKLKPKEILTKMS